MSELLLHHAEDTLEITFGEHHATVPWADVAPDATTGQRIYDDAVAYGKNLFATHRRRLWRRGSSRKLRHHHKCAGLWSHRVRHRPRERSRDARQMLSRACLLRGAVRVRTWLAPSNCLFY